MSMARWFEEGYKPEEVNPVEDLKKIVEESREYRENPLLVPGESKEMFDSAAQKARAAGIYVPAIKAVWRKEGTNERTMTIEEYKSQPFKEATIGDYWYTFDRRTRREIERRVKKGENPDIMNFI